MKKGIILLIFFISNVVLCQGSYKDIISETMDKHDFSKVDSLAKEMGFKGGAFF